MAIGNADLHSAVNTVWDDNGLNTTFNTYWAVADRTVYPVLNDGEATPHQPFPYAVYEILAGRTLSRMVRNARSKWEVRDVPLRFRVFAKSISGDARNAKQIAADLVEAMMLIFGGHPTTAPQPLVLGNGNFLIAQYDTDYLTRADDDVYVGQLNYNLRVDVPVTVV